MLVNPTLSDPRYKEAFQNLDNAISEFHKALEIMGNETLVEPGETPESGFVVGWVLGVGTTGFTDGEPLDGFLYETSAGCSRWMAKGLADDVLQWADNPGVEDDD